MYDNIQQPKSAWSPLKQSVFRALWLATIASNIGTWMQDVGAGWLMTSLAPSPIMVALVESSISLPMFILAIPAGAIADILDRRRLLLITQTWMMIMAAALGICTYLGVTTPWLLLLFTFLLGFGGAMNAPAWQAIVPEIVSVGELPEAVTLNAMGFNISRAIGPALGGLVVGAFGAYAVFLLNAVTFLGVLVVLYGWKRPRNESTLPSERLFGAMRAGLRYVRRSPSLRAVLVRSMCFIAFASALWALLPLFARHDLGRGPAGYGVLLTCLGLGAVTGALLLPRLRQKVSLNVITAGGTIVFALVLFVFARVHIYAVACVGMFLAGSAWLTLLSSLNASVQSSVPSWVRARALSVYLLVFFGGFAGGSIIWGFVAAHIGITDTFLIAGAGLILGLGITARFRLQGLEGLDLTPTKRWPAPVVTDTVDYDDGPVLVTIEYRINPAMAYDFALAMEAVSALRLRDGAIRWNLFKDTADSGRYLETFVAESWLEHLRQHERVTIADRFLLDRVLELHIAEKPPVVSHFIAERMPKRKKRGRA